MSKSMIKRKNGAKIKSKLKEQDWRFIKARYHRSNRAEKTKLLNELCDLYGYNRQYLLQVLNNLTGKRYVKKGPRVKYEPTLVLNPLKKLWLATDQMCSRRLKAAILLWLPYYEQEYGLLPPRVKELLINIGRATIDRLLKPIRAKFRRKSRCGTKPGTLIKKQIPIKLNNEHVDCPGFVEADTVAHCGGSLKGNFVWSITLTDIFTGWTENRATWGKGGEGVLKNIKDIEACLPFNLLGFNCDNGSEFLNWHLMRYFEGKNNKKSKQKSKIKSKFFLSRSRPYHKDDNAHVEQKNWTHVRQLFGYDRFDNKLLVDLMNDLYRNEWSLLQNHFSPSMKLEKKQRIGSKYHKKYEEPKTPYQRIMENPNIPKIKKQQLKKIHEKLNPFTLQKQIQKKLKNIFKYVHP